MADFTTTVTLPTADFIFYTNNLNNLKKLLGTRLKKDELARFEAIHLELMTQAIDNSDAQSIKDYYKETMQEVTGIAEAKSETPTV